jgi:hypothetical protein
VIGLQYPFGGVPFTTLGISYQQALRIFHRPAGRRGDRLRYPAGREGRITTV